MIKDTLLGSMMILMERFITIENFTPKITIMAVKYYFINVLLLVFTFPLLNKVEDYALTVGLVNFSQ